MTSIDPADQSLLEHLGSVATEVDPPPPLAYELGRAAFGTRTIDAELVRLVEDTVGGLAGVRTATSQPRLLTFVGSQTTLDLQLTDVGGHVSLVGQVMPVPEGRSAVRVETADGTVTIAHLDSVGGFSIARLPEALLRVRVEVVGGAVVATTWFSP